MVGKYGDLCNIRTLLGPDHNISVGIDLRNDSSQTNGIEIGFGQFLSGLLLLLCHQDNPLLDLGILPCHLLIRVCLNI